MDLWQLILILLSPVLFVAFCMAPVRTTLGVVWVAVIWSVIEIAAR